MPQTDPSDEDLTPAATLPALDGRCGGSRDRKVNLWCTHAELLGAQVWARRHGLSVSALGRRLLLRQLLPTTPRAGPHPATRAAVQELMLLRQALEQACRLFLALRDHDGSSSRDLAATLRGEVAQALATIDRLQHTLLGSP